MHRCSVLDDLPEDLHGITHQPLNKSFHQKTICLAPPTNPLKQKIEVAPQKKRVEPFYFQRGLREVSQ
jgi:hypothetical protein